MISPMTDISNQVSNTLLEDPRTHDHCSRIDVAADRGMITLTGSVPTVQVRDAAEEIARNTPGVISVINELRVEK